MPPERFRDTLIMIIDIVLSIFCKSRVKGKLLSSVKSAGQLPKCLLVVCLEEMYLPVTKPDVWVRDIPVKIV